MKRAFTLVEVLVVVVVLAIIAAFLMPVVSRPHPYSRRASCQSNLKQMGLGFRQYVEDYDQKLPLVHIAPTTGWADSLFPYVKSTQLFQCPSTSNASGMFATDYFYNNRLNGAVWDKLTMASLVVLSGDGEDESPTWNSWAGLPADAMTNSSPAQRHPDWGNKTFGGANYSFADGHVKWYTPDKISSTYASPTSRPTFAVR